MLHALAAHPFAVACIMPCVALPRSAWSLQPPLVLTFHARALTKQVRKVQPADVVIVEGILVLHDPKLGEHLNMKVRRRQLLACAHKPPCCWHRRTPCAARDVHEGHPSLPHLTPFWPSFHVNCPPSPPQIYVDTDDDVRLARRIQRDVQQRGRDVAGVIEQYTRVSGSDQSSTPCRQSAPHATAALAAAGWPPTPACRQQLPEVGTLLTPPL